MNKGITEIKAWHEKRQTIVKYLPIASALVMLVHVVFLLMGISVPVAEITFGTSVYGCILMLFTSHGFGFCWLHRQFIVYTFIMTMCIHYQRTTGFGQFHLLAQWIMCIYGLILFALLIHKKGICQQ